MKASKTSKNMTKATKERSQGKLPGSGVNKPVNKPAMKTYRPGGEYTRPDQKQKV
jgi:hypothetical protein